MSPPHPVRDPLTTLQARHMNSESKAMTTGHIKLFGMDPQSDGEDKNSNQVAENKLNLSELDKV